MNTELFPAPFTQQHGFICSKKLQRLVVLLFQQVFVEAYLLQNHLAIFKSLHTPDTFQW